MSSALSGPMDWILYCINRYMLEECMKLEVSPLSSIPPHPGQSELHLGHV